jgi:hypothetical protein
MHDGIGLMVDRAVLVIELRVGRSMGRRSRRSLLLLNKFWNVLGYRLHCKIKHCKALKES